MDSVQTVKVVKIDVVEMEKPKTENLENPCFPYIYHVERVALMLVDSVSNLLKIRTPIQVFCVL